VIATFCLTILGTFLTRSGVVQSVHAFSNSDIGPLLLGFFGVVFATGLGLIGALGITKVVFLIGSGFAAVLGIRTTNRALRTRALIVLSFLVVMLFAVAINNLYWISTSI